MCELTSSRASAIAVPFPLIPFPSNGIAKAGLPTSTVSVGQGAAVPGCPLSRGRILQEVCVATVSGINTGGMC